MASEMPGIKQVTTYDDPAAAAAWRRATTSRSSYLADPTQRILELARIAPGHRVLVVGTGTGEDALDVAVRVDTTGGVVATDLSAAMIAEAARTVAGLKVANVRYMVMDAQHLAFASGSFDAVISRNALMFMPDLQLALSEMKRVLKAGGRMGALVWASGRRNPRLSGPLEAARALGAKPPTSATFRIALRLGAPSLLKAALQGAGFSDATVERCPLVARYAGVDQAVDEAMDHGGTRELVRLLSGESGDRMRRSLARRWQKYAADDGVHLPGEELVVVATKSA